MEKLLNIKEAADFIGLSVPGVYGLTHKRQIPYLSLSARCIRFSRTALEQWLESKVVEVGSNKPTTSTPGQHRSPGRPRKYPVNPRIAEIVENAKREVMG